MSQLPMGMPKIQSLLSKIFPVRNPGVFVGWVESDSISLDFVSQDNLGNKAPKSFSGETQRNDFGDFAKIPIMRCPGGNLWITK